MPLNRRIVLKSAGAASLIGMATPGRALAASAFAQKKLVIVFLRGAMDGLAVFPAYGDPDFERARQGIAMPSPQETGGVRDLDGFFGIHPDLPTLAEYFHQREVAVVHAVASPYRERSHFDAQNLIENGTAQPFGRKSGWINHALGAMGQAHGQGKGRGLSLTTTMPVALRGEANVATWSPSRLPSPDEGLLERLAALYDGDPNLSASFKLAKAANAKNVVASDGQSSFLSLMAAAARFMKAPTGPNVAFLELGGWDSHAGQMGEYGPLRKNLSAVDAGVARFKTEIGPKWNQTVIVFVTEFGRTVAMNGSKGTDHGTGGALFMVGGAVNGGRVIADWPGLTASNLYQGRDLKPTIDLRSVLKGVLHDHMGVPNLALGTDVFPNSENVSKITDLLR